MRDLICEVVDSDLFSKALIVDFIKKTQGLSLKEDLSSKVDIFFVDAELNEKELQREDIEHIVIVSANEKFVHSLFQKRIADYLYKPELSYQRFLKSLEKVKSLVK